MFWSKDFSKDFSKDISKNKFFPRNRAPDPLGSRIEGRLLNPTRGGMHAVAMQLYAPHLPAFDVESKGFFQLLPPPHSATFCVVESFLLESAKK